MKRSQTTSPPPEQLALFLFDVEEGKGETFPLPARGRATIGSAPSSHARLESRSLAPRHAEIDVGPPLRICDLGSKRGTIVDGRPLAKGQWVPLELDQLVELGSTMLLVQRHAPPPRAPLRIWDDDDFGALVEQECRRARPGDGFAILRVRCKDRDDRVPAALAEVLRPSDVAGRYADDEWEALLVGCDPAEADALVKQLIGQLKRAGLHSEAAKASFPGDGRGGVELLACASERLRAGSAAPAGPSHEVARGRMRGVEQVAQRLANSDLPILILGETGVGKDVLAQKIHAWSPRAAHRFVAVNCGELTESLVSSELFGHEKGTFTDAKATKQGLIEAADGGTLFLDEVGELSKAAQVMLLRVLQDKEVRRVGGNRTIKVDVRIIAATNRNLGEEVAQGRFRQDLHQRLNGSSPLRIPPLRERAEEIEGLALEFVREESARRKRPRPPRIDPAALALLRAYDWGQGNIRELKYAIERAVALCDDGVITSAHLGDNLASTLSAGAAPGPREPRAELIALPLPPRPAPPTPPVEPSRGSMRDEVSALQKQRILEALERAGHNQTRAAAELGISRRTLLTRLDEYGVPRPKKGR